MKPFYRRFFRRASLHIRRLERRPFVRKIQALTDHIVQVACRREYRGENPAIRAVYAPLRAGLLTVLALVFIIFGLGTLVPIESAAVAKGTIVVLSNRKTVQHLEGGIIRAFLVKEGDVVTEGQPLIELNDVAPKASQAITRSGLYASRVTEARLEALKNEGDVLVLPEEILSAAVEDAELAKAVDTQRDLFITQREMQAGKLNTLRQRIAQHEEEIHGLEAQVRSAGAQIALLEEEMAPMERLVKKGYVAKPQLLALQRHREELEGNRGHYLAQIAQARQGITETEMQIANVRNEFSTRNADELRDVQAQVAGAEEKLLATSDIVSRTVISAPHEGIVTGLKYHTVGGVVGPGTPIMDIVPQNEKLVVEAQVQPADIDVVAPGLPTRLLFSSYKTRSLPRLSGKVTRVSADAFSDAQSPQSNSYYTARIEVDNQELARVAGSLRLHPGMPVEVFINTGSRSFLGYMFAPITGSLQRAFKED